MVLVTIVDLYLHYVSANRLWAKMSNNFLKNVSLSIIIVVLVNVDERFNIKERLEEFNEFMIIKRLEK